MSKEIPTTLELLERALSHDEEYFKRKSILESDVPCMDTSMNMFFRNICRNWEFDILFGGNLPTNKMQIYYQGSPANKYMIQMFARLTLNNDRTSMFPTSDDTGNGSIHFHYFRGSLLRVAHLELSLNGYMILYTEIC